MDCGYRVYNKIDASEGPITSKPSIKCALLKKIPFITPKTNYLFDEEDISFVED